MTAARQDTASAALAVGAPDVLQHPHGHAATIRRWTLAAVAAVAGLLVAASPAHAQFGAGLQGTVLDSSGASVPGATIVITNEETGVPRETVASDAGFYRIAGLPPGRYTWSRRSPASPIRRSSTSRSRRRTSAAWT